ncbi:V-type ATPase subunit [Candidatus Halobeggiatoa sp. HSG11]|nr:V-type ATPase subunit [Candidatus Halobeggiatoa sp. HSG11]
MDNYAYLNARVSILASNLLSETELTNLLEQDSFSLQNDELDKLLNDDKVSSNLIEQAWLMRTLADFQVLLRPLSMIERNLLLYWFRKCDIANLKAIVRGKIAGLDIEAISQQLLDLGPLTALPIEQLLHSEDVGELLRRLEHSPYSNIARQTRRVFEKEHQLYSLDAAIDRHYMLGFIRHIMALDAVQRRHILPLVSIFVDRFNLLWLLRYRFAYNLSAAETYYLLIPTPFRLNRTLLQKLVELDSLTEVLEHLPEPFYSLLSEVETTFVIDQKLIKEVHKVAEVTLKLHSFTLAKVFAYILLRETEMRRVMAILKGKRLNLNKDIILKAAEYSM